MLWWWAVGCKEEPSLPSGTASETVDIAIERVELVLDGTATVTELSGIAAVTLPPADARRFLNLTLDGEWVLQNAVIGPGSGSDSITDRVPFALPDGASGDGTVDVSEAPRDDPPTTAFAVTVSDVVVDLGPSELSTEDLEDFDATIPERREGGPLDANLPTDDFPNQETPTNDCARAAVSNAVRFLNQQHDLGLSDKDTSMDAMAVAMNEFPVSEEIAKELARTGTSEKWFHRKESYMRAHGIPIATRAPTSWQDLAEAIESGGVAEMSVQWLDLNPAMAHAVAVVGISTDADGHPWVRVSHDREQGKPGGTNGFDEAVFDGTDANGNPTGCFLGRPVVILGIAIEAVDEKRCVKQSDRPCDGVGTTGTGSSTSPEPSKELSSARTMRFDEHTTQVVTLCGPPTAADAATRIDVYSKVGETFYTMSYSPATATASGTTFPAGDFFDVEATLLSDSSVSLQTTAIPLEGYEGSEVVAFDGASELDSLKVQMPGGCP